MNLDAYSTRMQEHYGRLRNGGRLEQWKAVAARLAQANRERGEEAKFFVARDRQRLEELEAAEERFAELEASIGPLWIALGADGLAQPFDDLGEARAFADSWERESGARTMVTRFDRAPGRHRPGYAQGKVVWDSSIHTRSNDETAAAVLAATF